MKGKIGALAAVFFLCMSAAKVSAAQELLDGLTLEEKVAQLFFITPEALTGVDVATAAGEVTKESFDACPVGGIIYFQQNILDREQLSEMLQNTQSYAMERLGFPVFLAVDEEGGTVARVYRSGMEGIPDVGDMLSIGQSGDVQNAYRAGEQIGTYLKELHFNVDFAPVADIFSNPQNTVIGDRAFGSDADTAAPMVEMAVRGLQEAGVQATLKHFPGHGDTAEDSHVEYAISYKTLDELRASEFVPFEAGIREGAGFVMMGHISLPNVLEDYTPASLSYTVTTEILRKELGFDGIIITDALNMGAIAENYTSGEAAVKALQAGADMLLMPADFADAYAEVCAAVRDGRLSEERINESVERILSRKSALQKNA